MGLGPGGGGALAEPMHRQHAKLEAARQAIASECRYCAAAFGVQEAAERSRIPLLGVYEGHLSRSKLIADGYQVITF